MAVSPVSPRCDPGCASVQITECEKRKISGLKPDTCHFSQNHFYISNVSPWWNLYQKGIMTEIKLDRQTIGDITVFAIATWKKGKKTVEKSVYKYNTQ